MRTVIALLVLGLLVGCAAQETAEVEDVQSIGAVSEIPFPGADTGGAAATEEPLETTDLTTSQDTFDALDEAVGELE